MDYSHPLQLGCQHLREANQPLGQRPGPHSVPQGSRFGDGGACGKLLPLTSAGRGAGTSPTFDIYANRDVHTQHPGFRFY